MNSQWYVSEDELLKLALAESKKSTFKLPPEYVIDILQLPENFIVGAARDNGGCFFHSIAQSLNLIQNTQKHSEKSLRVICHQYYLDNKMKVDEWNKADNYLGDYNNIQFTEGELFIKGRDKAPTWGRPAVEGRILCEVYDIKKILVIDITRLPIEDVEGVYTYQPFYNLCTKDGLIEIYDALDVVYDETMPIIFSVEGELHFDPILPKREACTLSPKIITNKPNSSSSFFSNTNMGQNDYPDIKAADTQDLTTLLNTLNQEYLLEKEKEEYKPYQWQQTLFGWNNSLAWQLKASELRLNARSQLENHLRVMSFSDKDEIINHALTLEIFKEHRSNYINTEGDTSTVTLIKGLRR